MNNHVFRRDVIQFEKENLEHFCCGKNMVSSYVSSSVTHEEMVEGGAHLKTPS